MRENKKTRKISRMRRIVQAFCLLLGVLLILPVATAVTVAADEEPMYAINTDGTVYCLKNYKEVGVTAKPILGVNGQTCIDTGCSHNHAADGYNYDILFGYLLSGSATDDFAEDEKFLQNEDPYKWINYGTKAEYNDPKPSNWHGSGNNAMKLYPGTQTIPGISSVNPEGDQYKTGYEVDLGSVNSIAGYVMHFVWVNGYDKNAFKYDFDFYVSADGENWTRITRAKTTNGVQSIDATGDVAVGETYDELAKKATDKGGMTCWYGDHPIVDVRFGAAVEARYIRVLYTSLHASAGNTHSLGMEIYKAGEGVDNTVKVDPKPAVVEPAPDQGGQTPDAPNQGATTTTPETESKSNVVTRAPQTTNRTPAATTEATTDGATENKGCMGLIAGAPLIAFATVMALGMTVSFKKKEQ